jgi:hypothetical protein
MDHFFYYMPEHFKQLLLAYLQTATLLLKHASGMES